MKKIITFSAGIIFSLNVFSQAPNWLWAAGVTGVNYEAGNYIATDAAGNVFITGYFTSPSLTIGSTTLNVSGQQDIFVVKYSSSGNALWAKSAGGISYDYGYAIATDVNGNVFVAGNFQSASLVFGSDTVNNPGATTTCDLFIVKYDNNGNVLWAKSAGGAGGNEFVYGIATDASGNVFITGSFTSPSVTFGSTTLNNGGTYDVYIVKYDSNGNAVWAKGAGGSGMDVGQRMTTDAGGNIYVTGQFASPTITFGTTTLTNTNATFDLFTVKYDNSGNIIWAKRAGGTAAENVSGIAIDAGGSVYLTGAYLNGSFPFGSTTLPYASGYDIFTVKYDSNGNPLWANRAWTTATEGSSGIGTDASGNVFVTGNFQGPSLTFGSTTLTNAAPNCPGGCADIFVVKYDTAGNVLWAKSAGGTEGDSDNGMCTDASGNVFITGGFASPSLPFGSTTLTNPGTMNTDIFVAKLSGVVGIEENNLENAVNIFPNPATNQLTIENGEWKIEQIEIYNTLGEKVYQERPTSDIGHRTISIADFPSGIYFVEVTSEKSAVRKKIIKL